MKPNYRVEAFIVPKAINCDESSSRNEIDDVKVANIKMKLSSSMEDAESVESPVSGSRNIGEATIDDFHGIIMDVDKIYPLNEPIYDVPTKFGKFDNSETNEPIYDVPEIVRKKYSYFTDEYKDARRFEGVSLAPKVPARTSSLVSIDERGECDGIIEEFCFHGHRDGCTTKSQRPEQVSEEIFQANWLRRLETLREREAKLTEREILLQERERLLFKKERELRILERLVKDKLRKAELHAAAQIRGSSRSIETINSDGKTRSSENSSQNPQCAKNEKILSLNNDKKASMCRPDDNDDFHRRDPADSVEHRLIEKGSLNNPPNSRSSLWNPPIIAATMRSHQPQAFKSQSDMIKNIFPCHTSTYSSMRMSKPKIRPRVSYDDLDSTLSADIGDSSYVVTSKKFDPTIFKKPHAFTRSSSERRTRNDQDLKSAVSCGKSHVAFPINQRNSVPEEKKKHDNILLGHDDDIKYQDYGLIDERVSSDLRVEARNSYLNLERTDTIDVKTKTGKIIRAEKNRPNSWNEETNEWLQKKRQAYNMATMTMPNENFENKENTDGSRGREKMKKSTKKKDSRTKKFAIFR